MRLLLSILMSVTLIFVLTGCSAFTTQPADAMRPPVVLGNDLALFAQQKVLDLTEIGEIPTADAKKVATAVWTTQAVVDLLNGKVATFLNEPLQTQADLNKRWAAIRAK